MAKKEEGRLWPLHPLPGDWLRGPSWLDGDDIVMDVAAAHHYRLLAEPDVGIKLARARTPVDAVAFVRRFGMLRTTPKYLTRGLDLRTPLREPFSSFEAASGTLRQISETVVLVRRGGEGDVAAVRELRRMLSETEGDVFGTMEARSVLMNASQKSAEMLSEGLAQEDSRVSVYDRAIMGESVAPGAWRIGTTPHTLVGACFLSVALALAEQRPIGICEDEACRRIFFVEDPRQRFCTAKCSNRARYRRHRNRQEGE